MVFISLQLEFSYGYNSYLIAITFDGALVGIGHDGKVRYSVAKLQRFLQFCKSIAQKTYFFCSTGQEMHKNNSHL